MNSSKMRNEVSADDIAGKVKAFRQSLQIEDDCPEAELERAAKTSVALDRLVDTHALDMLAYYHKGSGLPKNEDAMSSIILATSMLTGAGIPVAGEYEVKNVIAMKILDLLGVGGSFTEYYAMDFVSDVVLMGHDGPGHISISQNGIRVRPLRVYHGKVGRGLSVEMSIKHGPVTLLSLVEDKNHGFSLLVAEGESVPGEILAIGNTNSRYRFPSGAAPIYRRLELRGPSSSLRYWSGEQRPRVAENRPSHRPSI